MKSMQVLRLVSYVSVAMSASTAAVSAEDVRPDLTPIPVVERYNMIGVGFGVLPEHAGSKAVRPLVLPIVRASYRDTVYINALQAGVWLLDSADKNLRVGLALEPRFGWKADGAQRVAGMAERSTSFDGGLNILYATDIGVFTANLYQDIGGASDGQSAQVSYIRNLVASGGWFVNGVLGLQWSSAKLNDYYFGVRADEVRPDRPQYSVGASTGLQFGLNGAYQMTDRASLLFGFSASVLGRAPADSPITETRLQAILYTGLGWSF